MYRTAPHQKFVWCWTGWLGTLHNPFIHSFILSSSACCTSPRSRLREWVWECLVAMCDSVEGAVSTRIGPTIFQNWVEWDDFTFSCGRHPSIQNGMREHEHTHTHTRTKTLSLNSVAIAANWLQHTQFGTIHRRWIDEV